MAPHYVEHRAEGLERWAECAWERAAGNGPAVARVIPDGCIDLVWSERGGLIVAGPNTSAFLSELRPGGVAMGVRLHPGCAPPLLGASAESLRDARVPAAGLLGSDAQRLAYALGGAPEPGARRAALVAWLTARAGRAPRPDPLVRVVARRLAVAPERRVGPLARDLGIGERQLRRRMVSQVGYGPKLLGRILRLRRALADARSGASLAEAAFGAGYADQAHFTDDCRDLAGLPPGGVLSSGQTSVFSKTERPPPRTIAA